MWWIENGYLCQSLLENVKYLAMAMIILLHLLHALRFVLPLVAPPGGHTLHTGAAVSLPVAIW